MLDQETRTALTRDADNWRAAAARCVTFLVTNDASAAQAASLAKNARETWRALEEKRKTITRPILEAKNATDALFKPQLDALREIEQHMKAQIGLFHQARQLERIDVLTQSAAQISQGIVPTEPIPEPVHVPSTSIKQVWDFEVVDPEQVPRELCSPDTDKIKQAIWYADTEHTPPRDIPGLRFFLRAKVTVR